MFLIMHDLPLSHTIDMNKFRLQALSSALLGYIPFHPANPSVEDLILIEDNLEQDI